MVLLRRFLDVPHLPAPNSRRSRNTCSINRTPNAAQLQGAAKTKSLQMSEIQFVPNALLGIDVSHYQGQIDWVKVAESGVKFAFIKATDGVVGDPMAKTNADGARAAGVPFGLYHFWRPDKLEAAQFANFDDACEALKPDLPAVLDIETGALSEDLQQFALEWLASQQPPTIVYVSPSYAQINLTDPIWLSYLLWTAHYTELPQPSTDKWKSWTFWQRQANGSVPGIEVPVDIDWFNGDLADLQKLIRIPT